MILTQDSSSESKRRLLDALSRGLPAAGELLRQRRTIEEEANWEELQRSRQEEAVQDMRKRLASMPEPSSSPMFSSSSTQLTRCTSHAICETVTEKNMESATSSTSRVASRLEFLDCLSRGFNNIDLPSGNTTSTASVAMDGVHETAITQSPLEAASSVLGPDFFASVNALQERMAQRKINSKLSQSQSSLDVTIPRKACESSQSPPCQSDDSSRSSSRSSTRSARTQRQNVGVGNYSARVEPDIGKIDEALDAEGLQFHTEELLRWAEEVLQKAQVQNDSEGHSHSACPRMPAPPECRNGHNYRSRTPNTRDRCERQQLAEDWKDEVNRLHLESENELERLTSEAMRRQQCAQDDGWRHRVTSAAEEMRQNMSRWRLDQEGQHTQDPRRASSLPRPQRPSAPPCAPSAPRNFRKAYYSQNAQVATADVRWIQLEAQLDAVGSEPIHVGDIPWPAEGSSLTDVEPGDDAVVAKRKLAQALRRWHPDKWRRILDRVPISEHAVVMERVKTIAQRLLEEKAKLTGPDGFLRSAR